MSDSIGVVFTGPDKSLLDRSARAAEAAAKALRWESILDSKKRKAAKLEYDRLLRDAHDLRQLGVRLSKLAKLLRTPTVVGVDKASGADVGAISVRRGADVLYVGPERRVGPRRVGAGAFDAGVIDQRLAVSDRRKP